MQRHLAVIGGREGVIDDLAGRHLCLVRFLRQLDGGLNEASVDVRQSRPWSQDNGACCPVSTSIRVHAAVVSGSSLREFVTGGHQLIGDSEFHHVALGIRWPKRSERVLTGGIGMRAQIDWVAEVIGAG